MSAESNTSGALNSWIISRQRNLAISFPCFRQQSTRFLRTCATCFIYMQPFPQAQLVHHRDYCMSQLFRLPIIYNRCRYQSITHWLIPTPIVYRHTTGMAHFRIVNYFFNLILYFREHSLSNYNGQWCRIADMCCLHVNCPLLLSYVNKN